MSDSRRETEEHLPGRLDNRLGTLYLSWPCPRFVRLLLQSRLRTARQASSSGVVQFSCAPLAVPLFGRYLFLNNSHFLNNNFPDSEFLNAFPNNAHNFSAPPPSDPLLLFKFRPFASHRDIAALERSSSAASLCLQPPGPMNARGNGSLNCPNND